MGQRQVRPWAAFLKGGKCGGYGFSAEEVVLGRDSRSGVEGCSYSAFGNVGAVEAQDEGGQVLGGHGVGLVDG